MPNSSRTLAEEIIHLQKMRAAAKLSADVLDAVAAEVKPGVTTEQLNHFCHDMIVACGGKPASLGYKGFPKSICTSVNNVAAHGIPCGQMLNACDLLKIDVSVRLDGVYGDNCRTYFVGEPSDKSREITIAAYNAMMRGIEQVRPGNMVSSIGAAIERSATFSGYSVLQNFNGHGIGERLHMPPRIFPYERELGSVELQPGMIFTVEPILAENDKFSVETNGEVVMEPGTLAAQFEHTVLVTETGCEILTESPRGVYVPASIRSSVINLGRRAK